MTKAQKSPRSIITVHHDPQDILSQKCTPVDLTPEGLSEAKTVIQDMRDVLAAIGPASGLAAPQIGHLKRIFLYSWNRECKNLSALINPTFEPLSDEKEAQWEACFSSAHENFKPLYTAKIPRYTKIKAQFYTEEGVQKTYLLEHYAARVFQHERDHLDGIIHLRIPGVDVKQFNTMEELYTHFQDYRKITPMKFVEPTLLS